MVIQPSIVIIMSGKDARGSDKSRYRNVICKPPSYGLQLEIDQGGRCYGPLLTKCEERNV